MLTKLRFQNWRSLQDVTIEKLTPLTVFIGANSSGKTNIIDGLKFLQECVEDKPIQATFNRRGPAHIRTLGGTNAEPLEICCSIQGIGPSELTYRIGIEGGEKARFDFYEYLDDDRKSRLAYNNATGEYSGSGQFTGKLDDIVAASFGESTLLSSMGRMDRAEINQTFHFITERWQILDEGFRPPLSVVAGNYGDITVIDRDAANLPIMLHFLREAAPEKYAQLQDDLQLLMGHVRRLVTYQDDRETRFYIEEKHRTGIEAPTISAGTARLVAMLTAYYALDIGPRASMPGLVVIEEPDTAINPGLLRTFVAMLRRYVRSGNRQFILTTHNPTLLDFFEPSEVRVVERDMQGMTHVHEVSEEIWKLWKDDSTLGEVWLTNTFGGLAR